MKKQMRALETKVTALRADADRLEERLEAMELNAAVAARSDRRHARRGTEERPPLKVIRLSPDEDAPAEEPSEAAEPTEEPKGKRPVIRGKGDNVIKTGASVQWRRGGRAGKSEDVVKGRRLEAPVARLSPPFPGIPATRRVFGQE
jgi:hypothetical protein